MNNVVRLVPRLPKPKAKGYVSLSQAERQRCAAIFQAPEAQGSYAAIARDLAVDTDLSAEEIIDVLRRTRATVRAEIAEEMAAGRFNQEIQ